MLLTYSFDMYQYLYITYNNPDLSPGGVGHVSASSAIAVEFIL
jgi:hypothetical protein